MADLRNFTYDNMVELIRQIRHGVDEDLTEIDEKIDKNTEDISDINDTVEGLVSQNINPNIFRGTNVYAELQPVNSSDTWSTGEWCLYSNSSGTNSVQPIELTDSPIDDIEVGWEIDNSEGILQSNIPLEAGTYTISAYIRGDGNAYLVYLNSNGTSTTQSLGSSFSDWTYIAVTLNNTLDSQTLGFSHSSTSSGGPGGSGGGPGGSTTNQSIEICGMKLETGDSETAWCPAYYDMENKYLQEDLDAVSSNITEVQNQVTEISSTTDNLQTQVTENATNISTAQQQITEIIAEGGEPNVIEEVQVNGATLTIEDKTVNVPVPTNISELNNDTGFITESSIPTKVSELENDSGYITVSAVPTKVSELENDSGYITEADVPTKLSDLTDDVGYAKESEIPTKMSELTNDSGYVTISDIPTKTSELENDSGFITAASVPTKTSELTNDSGFITSVDIPTKVSELTNDSGYITKSDVPTKLSELSDDVGYAKESEIPTKTSDLTNDSDFATNAEVKTEVAAQIAEVVADAPEDLDTLKEIADWIEGHAEDAAAMNSEIKANAADIAEIASQADSTQSQVDSIQSSVDSLQTQVDSVDELATANKTAIEDVQNQVESLQNQPSYVINYVKESKTLDISGG